MLPMIISHLSALLSVTMAVASLLDCVHAMLDGGGSHVIEVSYTDNHSVYTSSVC